MSRYLPGRRAGRHPGGYSNTNYLLLGQLLEKVTGLQAERCLARDVIGPVSLRETELAVGAHIEGPHSRLYEAWFRMIDPPRDHSVHDMSWVGPSASLISTVADLNRFYALLLAGEIVTPSSLAEMQRTVPVVSPEGRTIDYGLGLHPLQPLSPGQDPYWGHGGTVQGGGTPAMARADDGRQWCAAVNLQRWNELDTSGRPQPHAIDAALAAFHRLAANG